jgi:hypothetical protein
MAESPDYKELLQILNDFEVVILPLVQLVYRLVIGPYIQISSRASICSGAGFRPIVPLTEEAHRSPPNSYVRSLFVTRPGTARRRWLVAIISSLQECFDL